MTHLYKHLIFLGLLLIPNNCSAQETSQQFKRLDRNGDNEVTPDELKGPIFKTIDTNSDGVITPEEDGAFTQKNRRNHGPIRSQAPGSVETKLDIPYAASENPRQRLDLYLPKERDTKSSLPIIAYIHGGGWQQGDKRGGYRVLAPFVESGNYIGASIGYRLSGEAIWPAQIHDCKAAIRWIRANAKEHNIDPEKIAVIGTSAGGHLVAMLGTTGDVVELEGRLGENAEVSSRVTCVVDEFGPTDLLAMGGSHNKPDSPEAKLIGGAVQQNKQAARAASPISYVSSDDAPFLILHGTADPTVPYAQSELLHAALQNAKVESTLIPIQNGGHGGFDKEQITPRLQAFFDQQLRGIKSPISNDPIQQLPRER